MVYMANYDSNKECEYIIYFKLISFMGVLRNSTLPFGEFNGWKIQKFSNCLGIPEDFPLGYELT